MKKIKYVLGALVLVGVSFVVVSAFSGNEDSLGQEALIKRGEYLVKITGRGDCHSPHGKDGKPIPGLELSGHPENMPLPKWESAMLKDNILATINPSFTAFASPMGVAVAGNLTPDEETGIGKLTAEMLIESWRTGNHWKFEKRQVLPPMPMQAYMHMTDEDIRAIYAYLMSLKPVKNAAPASIIAPPPDDR